MGNPAGLSRYARQIVLPEVGLVGQERLRDARVLIVGAGGLGSPAALYLAAAGVGTIGIMDDDHVEISNLHRQVLHGTEDIGREKSASATDSLLGLNPEIEIRPHRARITSANAVTLIDEYDLVVDGSDNYTTRYVVNDACAQLGKPWVYGSVERFTGQVSVFGAPDGPCYRCVFPEPPAPGTTASCEEIGVLGAVPGVIGSLQAVEALKYILGIGAPLVGRLLQLDLLTGQMQTVEFGRRPDCPACARVRPPRNDERPSTFVPDIEPTELVETLAHGDSVVLVDVREPWEAAVARISDARLVPMATLPDVVESFSREQHLVLYCHHGTRSGVAAEWLRAQGFNARNLAGGIDRWSREIDPGIPRY